jgi:RNA polymerase sigma-54 factor
LLEVAYFYHIPLSEAKEILRLIQRSDPIGVGSATPSEALLVQLDTLSETKSVPKLAYKIIQRGLNLLSRHAYNEMSKLFGVSTKEVLETSRFIKDNLNPYPARAHWGSYRHQTPSSDNTVQPDIIINQRRNELKETRLVVEIIAPYTGGIRVNPLFRKAIMEAPPEKSEKWQMDLEQAMLLIKCLQQRNNTMVRLMKYITSLQREYILNGELYLQSMTRAEIALELGVHEATISRAVSGKIVQIPNRRIIRLSLMFDRSLPVRAMIRDIITNERKPLNDSQISKILAEQGVDVARRTVAKYRSMEGILPARLRNP